MRRYIEIKSPLEEEVRKRLEVRNDFKSLRIKKLLNLPDLTRKPNSPVQFLVDAILSLPRFKDFDIVDFPRIVTLEENFDLLNTPKMLFASSICTSFKSSSVMTFFNLLHT